MSLNDVKFVKGVGGLGRVLPNEDHITGMIFGKAYRLQESEPDIPFESSYIADLADAVTKGVTVALYPKEHAQIKEFFEINPAAQLYVGFETGSDEDFDFAVIEKLVTLSGGKIRQIGILLDREFDVADIAKIQTIETNLEAEHKPFSVILSAPIDAVALSALPDLRLRTEQNVSVLLASDVNQIGAIGNIMGLISLASVHENIGWIEKFKADRTGNYSQIYFVTGDAYETVSSTLLDQLNTKGYIFMRHHVGIAGSYYNDSHTCTAITSDYAYLENNRTIAKSIRAMRIYLLPKLNSPIEIDPTSGKIDASTIKLFENTAGLPLEQMLKDGELSGYNVTVDPNQDVLTTSELKVTVQLVIKGVARTITVTVGFVKTV